MQMASAPTLSDNYGLRRNMGQRISESTYVRALGNAPSSQPRMSPGTPSMMPPNTLGPTAPGQGGTAPTPMMYTLPNGKVVPQYEDTQAAKDARRQAYIAKSEFNIDAMAPYMPMSNYTQANRFAEDANNRANTMTGAAAEGMAVDVNDSRALLAELAHYRNVDSRIRNADSRMSAEQLRGSWETEKARLGLEGEKVRAAATTQAASMRRQPEPRPTANRTLSQAEADWLTQNPGHEGDLMAMRQGKVPGDPSTQPSAQPRIINTGIMNGPDGPIRVMKLEDGTIVDENGNPVD